MTRPPRATPPSRCSPPTTSKRRKNSPSPPKSSAFSFQALELADAAGPDQSLNQTLRLRGSAVSLKPRIPKVERKLDQVQRARRTVPQPAASPAEPPAAKPASGAPEKEALDLVAAAQEAIRIAQKTGGRNWAQNLQKRMMTAQIAENAKQQQAKYAGQNATAPQPAA